MKMLMLFSDGFEEIEAAAPIDLLRRAGVSVETCSITENSTLTGAHGIPFGADSVLPQELGTAKAEALAASYDGLLLPGVSRMRERSAAIPACFRSYRPFLPQTKLQQQSAPRPVCLNGPGF